MKQYLDLCSKVLENGIERNDRTNTGTIATFGEKMEFDLQNGFPIVTAKKTFYNAAFHELVWLLNGESNIKYLLDNNIKIWNEWADENGELGPVYGYQWRNWKNSKNKSQLDHILDCLKNNKTDRRMILSAWNWSDFEEMNLPPCHMFAQFFVRDDKYLDCQMYQRSADLFLGVPFDIILYSALTHILAKECNLEPGKFIHILGDTHIYKNHIDQVKEMLSRDTFELPTLKLNNDVSINNFKFEDIEVIDYKSNGFIKADVSV